VQLLPITIIFWVIPLRGLMSLSFLAVIFFFRTRSFFVFFSSRPGFACSAAGAWAEEAVGDSATGRGGTSMSDDDGGGDDNGPSVPLPNEWYVRLPLLPLSPLLVSSSSETSM
jgi:hypothetical protein